MLFLPIGDVNPARRVPLVNYALLAANIAVSVWMFVLMRAEDLEAFVRAHALVPAAWQVQDLVASQFLHGGWAHLAGNMLFLWIAGDNVEDKLGHGGYLLFYLASGAAAGAAHVWMSPGSEIPCVGASGAISGVLAAYAVLFPRSRIRVFYVIVLVFFIDWGVVAVPASIAIGLWFLQQLLYAAESLHLAQRLGDLPGVAYGAHVGGFVFGGASAMLLALLGIVRRAPRARWQA